MSKAILVLEDMPKSCWECPVAHLDYEYCKADKRTRYGKRGIEKSLELKNRPDWCPLKEVPKKKDLSKLAEDTNGLSLLYEDGYNSCIDEILGGADNEENKII